MDIKQLKCFVAVAEELNFTRAAEKIYMAQPPLSQQIIRLEEELELALFTRSSRHVELTAAGAALLPEARKVLQTMRTMQAVARTLRNGQRLTLKLGAVHTAICKLVPQMLAAVDASSCWVDVQVQEMSSSALLQALREATIDLAIVGCDAADDDIAAVRIYREPFVVACPAAHILAGKDRIAYADLEGEPLISITPASNPRYSALHQGMLREGGCTPRSIQYVPNMHSLICMVGAGAGAALVPASTRLIHLDDVVYRDLAAPSPLLDFDLAWRKDHVPAPLEALIAVCRKVAAQIGGAADASSFRKETIA